ncbi:MAG: RNA polymerase sigma factor [Patescibacteria group bacterium]|jgi:RNA polymerase sigma-70 factor (ECF subfamily)
MKDKNGTEDIQKLVQEAQAGDSMSVTRLYELFSDRIFRYLILRVSHRETAEDLTQTVFLEMIRSLSRYKKQKDVKFTTWLFQIARYRLIDHYRRSKTVLPIDELADSHPELQVEPEEVNVDPYYLKIKNVLHKLSEQQQNIIYLSYYEDMLPGEIAEITGLSAITVRVEKHRALTKIRNILSKEHLSL